MDERNTRCFDTDVTYVVIFCINIFTLLSFHLVRDWKKNLSEKINETEGTVLNSKLVIVKLPEGFSFQ